MNTDLDRTLTQLEEIAYRIRMLANIAEHVTSLGDDDDGLLEHVCYELPRRAAKLTNLVDRAQQIRMAAQQTAA